MLTKGDVADVISRQGLCVVELCGGILLFEDDLHDAYERERHATGGCLASEGDIDRER